MMDDDNIVDDDDNYTYDYESEVYDNKNDDGDDACIVITINLLLNIITML